MRLSDPFMMRRVLERDSEYQGRFFAERVGSAVYCLVTCSRLQSGKAPAALRVWPSSHKARRSGLGPCPECRPDDYGQTVEEQAARLDQAVERLACLPLHELTTQRLAEEAGESGRGLQRLFAWGGRQRPDTEILKERMKRLFLDVTSGATASGAIPLEDAVSRHLADQQPGRKEAGQERLASGTTAEPSPAREDLARSFFRAQRLSLEDAQLLGRIRQWRVSLPPSYPVAACLAYFERHAVAPHLAVEGNRLSVGCWVDNHPVRLDLSICERYADCEVVPAKSGPAGGRTPKPQTCEPESIRAASAHGTVLRLLGCAHDPSVQRFSRQLKKAGLPKGTAVGVRHWAAPGAWEAVLWAIAGQQVSLLVAGLMLSGLAREFGVHVGNGVWALPRVEDLVEATVGDFGRLKFSRQKAKSLTRWVQDPLDLGWLETQSQQTADRLLQQVHGIGPWSSAYILMRGLRFRDAWPKGDAPLARAWALARGIGGKVSSEQVEEEMLRLRPCRALATFQLWGSL